MLTGPSMTLRSRKGFRVWGTIVNPYTVQYPNSNTLYGPGSLLGCCSELLQGDTSDGNLTGRSPEHLNLGKLYELCK